MKQYLIDELRPGDYEKLKSYMDMTFGSAKLGGIYRILLEDKLLSDVQREHAECAPFYLSVELLQDRVACELLVRSENKIRCNCIAYTTPEQRNHFIALIDAIFEKLEIIT